MKKQQHAKPSKETVDDAMKIARATQVEGQTKEQTKLIAKGIQKGIEQYKKQQKVKSRAADKAKKQLQRSKQKETEADVQQLTKSSESKPSFINLLPWLLLIISWVGFAIYLYI